MVVSKKLMKVRPWGGAGGHPWDDGGHSGIRSITISYDRFIDSIRQGRPGRRRRATRGSRRHSYHSGTYSICTHQRVMTLDTGTHVQIKLSFADEYLTAVSGHYSPIATGGSPVIRSLAFRSNQRAYGPFGAAEGAPFTFPVDGRMYDRVQKLGLSAYRAVMQRIGPQQQQEMIGNA